MQVKWHFLRLAGLALVFAAFFSCSEFFELSLPAAGAANEIGTVKIDATSMPTEGTQLPALKEFDEEFAKFLKAHDIPGAVFTLAYKGKILISKGYGFADKEGKKQMTPDSVFRLASLSKPMTAIGILSLCEKGKLSLDQKAFAILSDLKPCDPRFNMDARISKITVRDLLQCSAGWIQAGTTDPVFGNGLQEAAQNCTTSLRPNSTAIVRKLLESPLNYDPGTNYSYSNVSFCVLGLIIEKISGKKYEEFINELLLRPEHLDSVKMGKTLKALPQEVKYYPTEGKCQSLLPNLRGPISAAYGGSFLLEAAPAAIGWVASTKDMVRFASIIAAEGSIAPPLSNSSIEQMLARPNLEHWQNKREYFALGWEVQSNKDDELVAFSRHGSLPGCMTLVEHQANGITWAAAFNSRPTAYEPSREFVKVIIKKAVKELQPILSKN